MAGKKRNPKLIEIPSLEKFKLMILGIDNLKVQALISLLYLTGGRVSEITGKKGIRPDQFFLEEVEGKKFMIIKAIRTLKKRKKKEYETLRNIPIPLANEEWLLKIIDNYIEIEHIKDNEPIFNLTRQRIWSLVNKYINIFPHELRHIRNTHLSIYYGFNSQDKKEFNNWSSIKPDDFYTHLSFKDIAKKMILT